jgi:dihydrofolate reductase
MTISIIVAMDKNRVIGKDNKLPWNIPEDLKNFKRITTGNTIIMGRNTYESIGRPLPKRNNIVISRTMNQSEYHGITIINNIDDAIAYAQDLEKNIYIIGGAKIYEQTLDKADKLIVSYVKKEYEGDTYFPQLKKYDWPIGYVKDYGEFMFMVRYHWR